MKTFLLRVFDMQFEHDRCQCGHMKCYHHHNGMCALTLCQCQNFIQATKGPTDPPPND